jgi:hypothetical protein
MYGGFPVEVTEEVPVAHPKGGSAASGSTADRARVYDHGRNSRPTSHSAVRCHCNTFVSRRTSGDSRVDPGSEQMKAQRWLRVNGGRAYGTHSLGSSMAFNPGISDGGVRTACAKSGTQLPGSGEYERIIGISQGRTGGVPVESAGFFRASRPCET